VSTPHYTVIDTTPSATEAMKHTRSTQPHTPNIYKNITQPQFYGQPTYHAALPTNTTVYPPPVYKHSAMNTPQLVAFHNTHHQHHHRLNNMNTERTNTPERYHNMNQAAQYIHRESRPPPCRSANIPVNSYQHRSRDYQTYNPFSHLQQTMRATQHPQDQQTSVPQQILTSSNPITMNYAQTIAPPQH